MLLAPLSSPAFAGGGSGDDGFLGASSVGMLSILALFALAHAGIGLGIVLCGGRSRGDDTGRHGAHHAGGGGGDEEDGRARGS